MPKKRPEPFWRDARKCWFVQLGKRQHRLDPDETTAYRLYYELMAKPPEQPRIASPETAQAVEILDRFLDWCQKNRAAATYDWHLHFCQKLTATLPPSLPVTGLKPYHLTRVMDANDGWSNNTKHDFVTAISRAFNWALKQELIDKNPVAFTEKPAREARELATSPADFDEVMAAVTEPNFRALIRFAWESGVRPQEVRAVESRHVDFPNSRIVFPPKESKGKKKHRVVYLTAESADILRPLMAKHPSGVVFRNSDGNPWTKDAINCAFCRLAKKIGRKLHLGAWRKGYATEGLKAGVDCIAMSHLLGHSSPVMLAKVYAKVQQDPKFMAEMATRAKKSRET